MWFFFGIISFISFSLFYTYKKINSSWEGTQSIVDGASYKFKVIRYKNRKTGVLIGINADNECDYTFKRESWFDKVCKSIGLVVEFQVGNSKFDDLVFIVSDNDDFYEALSKKTEITDTVLEIFCSVDGFPFTVKKIKHNSGCLWVKLEAYSDFDETDIKKLTPRLIPFLEKMSKKVEPAAGLLSQSWKSYYPYKSAMLLGSSTALAITGYILLQQIILTDSPVVIDESLLFHHTVLVGGALLLCLIALTLYLLGRSPRTHRVLLEVILLGGTGAFLTSYAELRNFNHDFDSTASQAYEVEVLDKVKARTRKSTHYYLYTKDWLNLDSKLKIRVPYGTYNSASIGGMLILCQKSGALGYRWLDKIFVTQEVNQQETKLKMICQMWGTQEFIEGLDQKDFESLNALYRKMNAKKNLYQKNN